MTEQKQPTAEEVAAAIEVKFAKEIEMIMNGEKALSFSSLSQFMESPKHFKIYKTAKQEATKAMEEGKMFHMACLEPEEFKKKYYILDDSEIIEELKKKGAKNPRAKNEYKEWLHQTEEKNSGREHIDADLYETFIAMGKALNANHASGPLMAALTEKEQGFKFMHHDQLLVSGKIDGYGVIKENNTIYEAGEFTADLKKVADARFAKLKWKIKDLRYDVQGVIYNKAKSIKRHYLICIDMNCNITVILISNDAWGRADECFQDAMERFIDCAETDQWDASYEFWSQQAYQIL